MLKLDLLLQQRPGGWRRNKQQENRRGGPGGNRHRAKGSGFVIVLPLDHANSPLALLYFGDAPSALVL